LKKRELERSVENIEEKLRIGTQNKITVRGWGLGNPDETDVRVHELDGITLIDTSRCPECGAELTTDFTKDPYETACSRCGIVVKEE
jgi:ribosomal protein S27AE